MKLTTKRKEALYLSLAFFVPAVIILLFMVIGEYYPFGHYSYGISDNYHQYMPFFLDFRRSLQSGDSMAYNWNIGMGVDYLGLIPYYLASPLNLLGAILPLSEQGAVTYFVLLYPIRIALASLFFAIFLRKAFNRFDISIPFFGCFYGMCAWALAYQWNCMWLDTFALLPLVMIGALNLLKERKFVLYTTTLFLAVAANYYIGFFVCIFVLLAFVWYQICEWGGLKKFAWDVARFALYSAIALGMTAFITIPAFSALQSAYASVNQFPTGFQLNIADQNTWKGFLSAMMQVATNTTGGLIPSFKLGLPNLYCGVGCLMLALIYFTSKQVSAKKRICTGVLLLFLMASFVIRQLDYMWHGFHFTNQIPYRFSFLFSFIIVTVAYQMWLKRTTITSWQMYVSAGVVVLLIILTKNNSPDQWIFNILMILLYLCVFTLLKNRQKAPKTKDPEQIKKLCNGRRRQRHLAAWCMVVILCAELVMNYNNLENYNSIVSLEKVPLGGKDTAAVIEYMKENDDEIFYRSETTHIQTHNDGTLNNYHGISAFTSTANVSVTRYMQSLGLAAKDTYNRYWYEETSPVTNLFLNLKYMISRDGTALDNQYFEAVYSKGGVVLLENQAYLPLGFMVKEDIKNFNFKFSQTPFSFQNDLFDAATGLHLSVWDEITNTVVISGDNVDTIITGPGKVQYTNFDTEDKMQYTYEIAETGLLCIYVDFSNNNAYSVYKNGEKVYSKTDVLPQVLSVANVKPGDKIEIVINSTDKTNGHTEVRAAVLNEQAFREGYNALAQSTTKVVEFSNTRVIGTINCKEAGIMYTSIPQNGNWTVYVDGEEVEPVLIGDVMLGVPLTEGEHEVQFKYQNASFILGIVISLFALASLAFVIFLDRFHRRNFAGENNKKT